MVCTSLYRSFMFFHLFICMFTIMSEPSFLLRPTLRFVRFSPCVLQILQVWGFSN